MPSVNFEKNLEMGTYGEDIIYPWLVSRNSFVQDMRHQKHVGKGGPRLKGTEDNIALPDFAVYNKSPIKGNFAVEVKTKSSTYSVNGVQCFSVDEKFEDYKRCVQILKLDYLMMIFIYKNKIYSYRDSETLGRHYFGTSFGEWGYIFAHDISKVVY